MRHWGTRLTTTLASKNLSQAEVARQCNIPISVLNGWTTGHSPRDFTAVRRLCEHLDVSFCWLLTGDEDPAEAPRGEIEWSGIAEISIRRLK